MIDHFPLSPTLVVPFVAEKVMPHRASRGYESFVMIGDPEVAVAS